MQVESQKNTTNIPTHLPNIILWFDSIMLLVRTVKDGENDIPSVIVNSYGTEVLKDVT